MIEKVFPAALLSAVFLFGASGPARAADSESRFTIAVIPDTQNMVDYRHQKAEGFALDAGQMFLAELQYIADHSRNKGGDIVFATSVGDTWQHQSLPMDEAHVRRGFKALVNPWFSMELAATPKTVQLELPLARKGFEALAKSGIPFGVAPGNHDYDAIWSDSRFPPETDIRKLTMTPEGLGMLHIGGLDNFRSVFGADSAFFKDKPWYVASHNGGTSSAQRFDAGGYRFLHISLEMAANDEALQWASAVIAQFPGLPTLITTHDYLNTDGERRANPVIDLAQLDDDNNSAEQVWEKLVSRHDQIFMVLCGHHHGRSLRIDRNAHGNKVWQILADYQDRGQAAVDAGQPLLRGKPVSLGDGWLRLLQFNMDGAKPTVAVKTWSSHYKSFSSDLPTYSQWYQRYEAPHQSEPQYLAADDYVLELDGFVQRFGKPAGVERVADAKALESH